MKQNVINEEVSSRPLNQDADRRADETTVREPRDALRTATVTVEAVMTPSTSTLENSVMGAAVPDAVVR